MADTATLEAPPARKPKFRFTSENARSFALKSVQARGQGEWAKRNRETASTLQANSREGAGVLSATYIRPTEAAPTGPLAAADAATRASLAEAIRKQAEALAFNPGSKTADLTGRDGTAQTTKTLAEAGAKIFGWDERSLPGIVVIGDMRGSEPQELPAKVQQVIDVPSMHTEPVDKDQGKP